MNASYDSRTQDKYVWTKFRKQHYCVHMYFYISNHHRHKKSPSQQLIVRIPLYLSQVQSFLAFRRPVITSLCPLQDARFSTYAQSHACFNTRSKHLGFFLYLPVLGGRRKLQLSPRGPLDLIMATGLLFW